MGGVSICGAPTQRPLGADCPYSSYIRGRAESCAVSGTWTTHGARVTERTQPSRPSLPLIRVHWPLLSNAVTVAPSS
jgi:hypothetical protein